MPLEIACFNVDSALIAQSAGTDRIELCSDRGAGGLTPPLTAVIQLNSQIRDSTKPIPIYAMVRPRGGNFVYNDFELQQMKDTIYQLKPDVDGFVFGVLTSDSTINLLANTKLVNLAAPLPCTFHRAFDLIPPQTMMEAADLLVQCGFTSLLTSGGSNTATEGVKSISQLVRHVEGRLQVIVGGGVRSTGVENLIEETGAAWVHSSAIVGDGEIADAKEILRLKRTLIRGKAGSAGTLQTF